MELRTQYSYLVQNSLLGNEPIYGTVLTDPDDGLQHIFFVFPNLSVRYSGVFRLCCTVVDLENTVCSQICTDTFTVHSSKTYPGSNKKTELEKCFQKQGHAISRYHIA
ncbi:velvet factor [Globomyces pollinis-pini]|nr:velvet factor [Globomyces pollinis-pini]